ncbi:hypothetical protein pdam_00013090 [Pocillopora damicornis]|uniref:Uncharacterized protein n=1 Tax=Pocillopora damicornis TaxID=46731 RepID=A0A3M6TJJ6_POCDA|nr:hypothetical protein pdam_00013090 [Pocillopora damicornis]
MMSISKIKFDMHAVSWLKELSSKYGLEDFDVKSVKLYPMAQKSRGTSDNFALTTNEQRKLKLLTILARTGSELNSMYWNGWVFGIDCRTPIDTDLKALKHRESARHFKMPETPATNGPEGTVFNKVQVSLKLLEEGMRCLHNNIASINNDYLEDIELCTLLTIVVENLHATFTALPYSQEFGIITKGSLKRVTEWATKYFTHEKFYYRVPHSTTGFARVNFIYATATFRGDQPRD